MSLEIIKGGSGSGKSYKMYETFLEHAALYPNQNHIILVPEQYNLYTQRKLVALSKNGGIMNIEALSFERLAYRVFDELGTNFSDVLSDDGKVLLLRRICQENEDRLKVLSSGIKRIGFIDEIKSLISELMQYDISPEKLSGLLSEDNTKKLGQSFCKRMEDVAVIYEAFIESLSDKYITTEQILSLLVEVIEDSSFVNDAYIALDGYTGLTPLQRNLMRKIISVSEKTYACITIDENENLFDDNPLGLFSLSRDYAKSLLEIARECGVEVDSTVAMKGMPPRYKDSKSLFHLQSNIFRKKPVKYKNDDSHERINIYSFEQALDELSFVAKDINNKIKENPSLCYKDFAVLASDMSIYKYYIEDIFLEYDVPVFIDTKDNVSTHPLIRLVTSIVEAFIYDFSYETVMNIIDTGFVDITVEEADIFDNYIVACNIRFRRNYQKEFTRYVGSMESKELDRQNEIRKKLIEPFNGNELSKKDTVKKYTTRLYNIITAFGCEDKISEEDARVYRSIIDYFDKMVHLIGDSVVDINEYHDILMEGLNGIKIGVLPRSLDTVLFGDMERSRLGDVKVLYMIGMSDANIPKRNDKGGILLESERIRLLDMNIPLAPSQRQKLFTERFYIYLAVSKPSDALTVTFSESDSEGNRAKPAYFIEAIQEIFSDIDIKHISGEEIGLEYSSAGNLPVKMASLVRNNLNSNDDIPHDIALRLAYLKKKNPSAYDMLILAATFKHENNPLQKAIANKMVGESFDMSVSRLEKYAQCAYSYFLQYELRLKERREYGMELSDMGNIYHDALRRYSDLLKESSYTWFDIPDDESEALLEQAVNAAFTGNEASASIDTKREESILRRIKSTLSRSIWAISGQVREGMFEPKGFEVSIGKMAAASGIFELEDGVQMKMDGVIDRIDTYETGECVYIKIIDYKSGVKDIDLASAYDGLQLQLMFYLKAACEANKRLNPDKNVVPAAMLYYHVDNPMIEASLKEGSEQLLTMIKRALKNKGLVCSDSEVIEALDLNIKKAKEEGRAYNSFSIPVAIKKGGEFSSVGTKVLDESDMKTLGEYAVYKSVECGNKILEGDFEIKPVRDDNIGACDYCPYHGICGFDSKLPGFEYKDVTQEKDNRRLVDMMKEKMEQK